MEEFQNLRTEFETLRDSFVDRNIREIGVIELRRIKGDLERLHSRNLELQENVRFNRDIDTVEALDVLNQGDRLYDGIAELLRPVSETVAAKAALGLSKVRIRRELINARRRNQELIDMFNADLERVRTLEASATDETIKRLYGQNVTSIQDSVNRLNEVDAYYAGLISNLDKEIEVIRFGGRVPELEEIDEETRGIDAEEEEELRRNTEEERTEEGTDDSEEVEEEVEMPDRIDRGDGMPFNLVDDSEEEEDLSHDEEGDVSEDEEEEEMPDRVDRGDGMPFNLVDDSEEEEDLSHEEERDDSEEDEEEVEMPAKPVREEEEATPVDATARQPKSALWQKLQPVIEAVKIFLLTAIAIHTAHAIDRQAMNDNTNVEEVTETENDQQEEAHISITETPVTGVTTSVTNPAPTPAPAPSPSPTPAPYVPPTQERNGDTTFNLHEHEVVQNNKTGVAVGYEGGAIVDHGDGTYGRMQERALTKDGDVAVVTQKDLENDGEFVVNSLPRTGQEVSEAEARAGMTDQEEINFDQAAQEAFTSFFADGPTL